MKKIPTLFVREFENHEVKRITSVITEGMEPILKGQGVATVKVDGSCCLISNDRFYKRYDAKNGKNPPIDAIPCCDPDPITGHWPHWLAVDPNNPADKWHVAAFENSDGENLPDGTYEVIGPHFKANPYGLENDILVKHGEIEVDVPCSFEGIQDYLEKTPIEGLVYWMDGTPICKIKRSDFGFRWPCEGSADFFCDMR